GLFDRVKTLGFQLKIVNAAKDFIAEKGYDSKYGARPLKLAIQKYLEDPMAELLIKAEVEEGDTIHVGFNSAKSEIRIGIRKKKETVEKQDKASSEE
ncbi:MAG: ATP-dependent Clp protease ATP-binding subunit, partial [Bacteroidales bacterium]|nr:ATP-dependent Clp protease ATP-binding subunit [Bacteroidales bacterium]